MPKKKINKKKKNQVVFFDLKQWEIEYLKNKLKDLKGVEVEYYKKKLTLGVLKKIKNVSIVAGFIYSKFDKRTIESLPNLKYITTMSTGFDHIDLEICRERGVRVSNVPTYGENTVAEHAFALLLALSRRLEESFVKIREFDFSPQGLMGFDLKGKTLGIVGMGSIGQHMARMARAFEMKVIAFDPNHDNGLAKKIGFQYATMDKLLEKSDVISLHAPYNEHTHHMLDKDSFKKTKKGVYIINTARGALIDTTALVDAIEKGQVAGAGLDVLEEEVYIKEEKELLASGFNGHKNLKTVLENHWLIKDKRVIITPHNAFNSYEALHRILDTTASNIKSFLGGRVRNKVL